MGRKGYQAVVVVLAFVLTGLASCKKDVPNDPVKPTPQASGNVYIVCEGSLGNGNSTLSLYRPVSDSVFHDLYKAMNGRSLGDVFQSMLTIGDKLFLCINNSDNIVVLDKSNWKEAGNIGMPKPRYILPVNENLALVSSMFSNKVHAIDPKNMALLRTYDVPYLNPEGMLLQNGTAWICMWDTANNKLYGYEPNGLVHKQSYTLGGSAPQAVLADKDNRLWVLSGNIEKKKRAYLTCIDAAAGKVVRTYEFPEAADVIKPVFNNGKDTLYFIEVNYKGGTENNGIYRMPIADTVLPTKPFVAAAKFQYFWALGIEPSTGNIYVGDPKGFIQKGTVHVYRPDGGQIKQFEVGVGPGHFYFD